MVDDCMKVGKTVQKVELSTTLPSNLSAGIWGCQYGRFYSVKTLVHDEKITMENSKKRLQQITGRTWSGRCVAMTAKIANELKEAKRRSVKKRSLQF